MISLSNVWKSFAVSSMHEKRLIEPQALIKRQSDIPTEKKRSHEDEASEEVRKMLADAESIAEGKIRQALDEIAQLKAQAKQEIDSWWVEQRELLAAESESAFHKGFEQGWIEGREEGTRRALDECEGRLVEARQVVDLAHSLKDEVIAGAEPFLLELSIQIAKKILQNELAQTPAQILPLIKHCLSRVKEQEHITLSISPDQFEWIIASREELVATLGHHIELKILPDASITSGGCILRSTIGTLDAQLDTQLEELKKTLAAYTTGWDDNDSHQA